MEIVPNLETLICVFRVTRGLWRGRRAKGIPEPTPLVNLRMSCLSARAKRPIFSSWCAHHTYEEVMKCQALTAIRTSRILTSTELTASLMSRSCRVMSRRPRCAICQGKNASYRYRSARYVECLRPVVNLRNRACRSVIEGQRVLCRQRRQHRCPVLWRLEQPTQDVGRVKSRHPPGELSSSRTPYAGSLARSDNLNDKRASGGRFEISLTRLCTFPASPRRGGLPIPHSFSASDV